MSRLTIADQNQRALCFAASICDLTGKCAFAVLGEVVQDELDDACGCVMTHLVWLERGEVVQSSIKRHVREYKIYKIQTTDNASYRFIFICVCCILHWLQTVPCCWRRICRWHWEKCFQPAARTSFCLSPESCSPTLTLEGWLWHRKVTTQLHLLTDDLFKR